MIQLTKPALFLRNLKHLPNDVFDTLQHHSEPLKKVERIQRCYRSKDMLADLAVAYFNSEEDAYLAMKDLKSTSVEGQKLSVSFRYYLRFLQYAYVLYL